MKEKFDKWAKERVFVGYCIGDAFRVLENDQKQVAEAK